MREGARIVPLEPEHARIVPYLRGADMNELRAASGCSPALAVAYSIMSSDPGWAVELHGEPVAVFGAACVGRGVGAPWLVATEAIERHPIHFYRVSKKMIDELRAAYLYLENWVDARNTLSIRWLKWAGFTVEEAEPWGVYGLAFHRFWWSKR